MTRDMRLYIEDILDSIEKIEQYTKDINENGFLSDTQIPWKKIAGLRNVLIHEYFGVNLRRAWKAAKEDIISLKQEILKVAKDLKSL